MTALKGRDIDRFLARPDPAIHSILVYGPDRGLAAERARSLLTHYADDPADPFTVSYVDENDLAGNPERLADELTAIAFGGGRRTVLVRVVSAAPPAVVAEAPDLERDSILIVEAGDLKPSSPVRKAFEKSAGAAALPCYADDSRAIDALIDHVLAPLGQTITSEARTALASRLGADHRTSRSEIEKLSLYAGRDATISLDDVEAVCSDASQSTLDAIVDAMGEGRPADLDSEFAKATLAGVSPAQIATVALRHMQRLHRAASAMREGRSAGTALAAMRPPVHFKRKSSVQRQLDRWPEAELRPVLGALQDAERLTRLNPAAQAVVHRTLLRVALMKPRPGLQK